MKKTNKRKLKNTLMLTMMCAALSTIFLTSQKPMIKASASETFYEELRPTETDLKDTYIKGNTQRNYKYITTINTYIIYANQTTYCSSYYDQDEDMTFCYMLAITELHYNTAITNNTAEPLLAWQGNERAPTPINNSTIIKAYTTNNNPYKYMPVISMSQEGLAKTMLLTLDQKDTGRQKKYDSVLINGIDEITLPSLNVQPNVNRTIYFYTYLQTHLEGNQIEFKENVIYNLEGNFTEAPIFTEPVDIPGIMFNILTMPFAFISTAFNLTLFEGTPYMINFSSIFFGLLGIGIVILIIKLYMGTR